MRQITHRRDVGRKKAYTAEARAYGGGWWTSGHKSARLTEAEARKLHDEAVEFLRARLDLKHAAPEFKTYDGACSYFIGNPRASICFYAFRVLKGFVTASCVLHEVAHWGSIYDNHGKAWQRAFAILMRRFESDAIADEFLRLCDELPVMQMAAGPKKKWTLMERKCTSEGPRAVWLVSSRKRSDFSNAVKLQMWRGQAHLDPAVSKWYRLISD